MKTYLLASIREDLRKLSGSVSMIESGPQRRREFRRLRMLFFTKLRAIQHVDDGYPSSEFRLSLVPDRNRQLEMWIRNRLAYLDGERARFELNTEDANPHRAHGKKLSYRMVTLEAVWDAGFEGKKF